jgi:hypothetical protein
VQRRTGQPAQLAVDDSDHLLEGGLVSRALPDEQIADVGLHRALSDFILAIVMYGMHSIHPLVASGVITVDHGILVDRSTPSCGYVIRCSPQCHCSACGLPSLWARPRVSHPSYTHEEPA